MPPQKYEVSLSQAIEIILDQAENPINWDDFLGQVLELWPSRAKNPAASIRNALRYNLRNEVVLLEDKTVIPVNLLMKDVRFRITPSLEEIENSVVSVVPWFIPYLYHFYWEIDLENRPPILFDKNSEPIEFEPSTVSIKKLDWDGEEMFIDMPALKISEWFNSRELEVGDSILTTIKDYSAKAFILEHEPANARRLKEIEDQNGVLAKGIENVLFDARDDVPSAITVLKEVYARSGGSHKGYPGEHWSRVLEKDRRLMTPDFYHIGWTRLVLNEESPLLLQDVESNSLEQVYLFKAYLKRRKSLWRKIEIKGSNTLREFDREMRRAFEHDWDHLSEFSYKPPDRIRHGRWEGYGTHNPFESGYADEIMIAELAIEVDDQLCWVYNFGAWVEHLVTLENVGKARDDVEYPRVVEKNKPRYRSCVQCKAKGEKTHALWVCVTCSNREETEIWLCEECMMKFHDEHYVEKIKY